MNFNYNSLEEALTDTVFFVQCGDSFTYYGLWSIYVSLAKEPIPWQQISLGWWQKIGDVTYGSFKFAYIYGQLVCFYEPTGVKVDWSEMEKFLEPYYAPGSKRDCNAQNFHKCIIYTRALYKL